MLALVLHFPENLLSLGIKHVLSRERCVIVTGILFLMGPLRIFLGLANQPLHFLLVHDNFLWPLSLSVVTLTRLSRIGPGVNRMEDAE